MRKKINQEKEKKERAKHVLIEGWVSRGVYNAAAYAGEMDGWCCMYSLSVGFMCVLSYWISHILIGGFSCIYFLVVWFGGVVGVVLRGAMAIMSILRIIMFAEFMHLLSSWLCC